MILLAEHDEPSLAAKKKRQLGASKSLTTTPKNRVWSFENTPSGRPCVDPQLSWEKATGSVQFTYETASGRAGWLSRDPVKDAEQSQGPNLYQYVNENPVNLFDPLGLEGTWGFSIWYSKDEPPDIEVTYTMSADEQKCCKTVVVYRYQSQFGLPWIPDNDPNGGVATTGYGNHAANPGGDQGAGISMVARLGLPAFQSPISHDIMFKWIAKCTSGNCQGKTLSTKERTYTPRGYTGGNWKDALGSGG